MTQMRLQMRPDQTAALGRHAAERGVTVSELVRQAIDQFLGTEPPGDVIALPGSDNDLVADDAPGDEPVGDFLESIDATDR